MTSPIAKRPREGEAGEAPAEPRSLHGLRLSGNFAPCENGNLVFESLAHTFPGIEWQSRG
jgi:hypothetical protein